MSAAALRGLHVPGDPLVLPNAWDAATARAVAAAGFPAVATTSSGVAESLGYEDGEETPADEMLAAVRRISRVVDVPVTADLEGRLRPRSRRPRAAGRRRGRRRPQLRGHRSRERAAAARHRCPGGADRCAQGGAGPRRQRPDRRLPQRRPGRRGPRARAGVRRRGRRLRLPDRDRRRGDDRRVRRARHAGQRRPVTGGAADRAPRRARRRQDQPRPLPPRRDARRPGRAARRPQPPRYAFVIGIRRSRPNARGVILIPGGAWRRLYSARSTSAKTRSTASAGSPASASCSRPASSST